MKRPEVMIPQAQNKSDANSKLADQTTVDFILTHLAGFSARVLRLR